MLLLRVFIPLFQRAAGLAAMLRRGNKLFVSEIVTILNLPRQRAYRIDLFFRPRVYILRQRAWAAYQYRNRLAALSLIYEPNPLVD